jgi:hypothetical protein
MSESLWLAMVLVGTTFNDLKLLNVVQDLRGTEEECGKSLLDNKAKKRSGTPS